MNIITIIHTIGCAAVTILVGMISLIIIGLIIIKRETDEVVGDE